MWPFRSKFERHLRRHARRLPVRRQRENAPSDQTVLSITLDSNEFALSDPAIVGHLCALIFAQAQADGATCVRFHYGINRMYYTIKRVDYEMVPLPAPITVDLSRWLAAMARCNARAPGLIRLGFQDLLATLFVEHRADFTDPAVEVTGFTGEQSVSKEAPQTGCIE